MQYAPYFQILILMSSAPSASNTIQEFSKTTEMPLEVFNAPVAISKSYCNFECNLIFGSDVKCCVFGVQNAILVSRLAESNREYSARQRCLGIAEWEVCLWSRSCTGLIVPRIWMGFRRYWYFWTCLPSLWQAPLIIYSDDLPLSWLLMACCNLTVLYFDMVFSSSYHVSYSQATIRSTVTSNYTYVVNGGMTASTGL